MQLSESVQHPLYRWFFAPKSANITALYRIIMGSVLLLTVLLYATHLREFFSDEGYVVKEAARRITAPDGFSLLFWNSSPAFVNFLYVTLIASTVAFILGYWTRLTAFICYVLYLSFHNRFNLIGFDGSEAMIIFFFFTIFIDTGKVRWPRFKKGEKQPLVPGWGVRLLQINLVMIYLFAAFTKLRSQAWMGGGELLGIMNYQYAVFNYSWLANFPLLVNFLNYGTIIIELGTPFLIWFKETRRLFLAGALLMHIGIIFTLNVTYFSEVMIAALLLFARSDDFIALGSLFTKFKKLLTSSSVKKSSKTASINSLK